MLKHIRGSIIAVAALSAFVSLLAQSAETQQSLADQKLERTLLISTGEIYTCILRSLLMPISCRRDSPRIRPLSLPVVKQFWRITACRPNYVVHWTF